MIRKLRFIINSYWKVQGKQENPLSYMYIYDRKQIQFFFHSNFCHRYTHIYDDIGCFYNSHVCVWEPLNILFFSRLGAMGIRTHDLRILLRTEQPLNQLHQRRVDSSRSLYSGLPLTGLPHPTHIFDRVHTRMRNTKTFLWAFSLNYMKHGNLEIRFTKRKSLYTE